MLADGSGHKYLTVPAGGSLRPATKETIDKKMHYVFQDGKAVFKFAVKNMADVSREILDKNNIKGKDLKLFEVDEVVNKIRSEVEADAEVIIGAITDPSLEGKIRVSIVATALDGQQPETKSVINMVHRIQNRNPGYSDFSNLGANTSFNFTNTSPISSGATALKLENEVMLEKNDMVLFAAFGGGFTWGSMLIKWA